MPRTFIALTQQEIDLRIAESIKAREYELLAYDFEKAGHEAVISEVTAKQLTWTKETEKYRGLSRDQLIKAAQRDGLTSQQIANISDLLRLDFAIANKAACEIETVKSEKHYENALAALPEERRASAFEALALKEGAEPTK